MIFSHLMTIMGVAGVFGVLIIPVVAIIILALLPGYRFVRHFSGGHVVVLVAAFCQ